MRPSYAGFALLLLLVGCDAGTGPRVFRGDFSLLTLQGKLLPLPDGGTLLIGDSLSFDEARRPKETNQPRILATVVHQRPDGSVELIRGYQSYERRGDTVITSFACRFSDICLLDIVVAPEVGILRNDSLIFSPKLPSGPTRVYRRQH
jgi:hypothetical protein